jgi:predicted DNA-binding transcriptional regulator AlpA
MARRTTGNEDVLISEAELAARTGTSRRMWQEARRRGDGPPFVRISARCIRYSLATVEKWLAARTQTRTDAQPVPPADETAT